MSGYIKNFKNLAKTPERNNLLEVLESGLAAIKTENVIKRNVKLSQNILTVMGQEFDLSLFEKIKVVGFGKASCEAALALEEILGEKIDIGAVVGLDKMACNIIETFAGSHPRPTSLNTLAGEKIYNIVSNSTEKDLLIVVVSGGGSALLCASTKECDALAKLYDAFLAHGGSISEMNTVRKHLSVLKGGGLANLAYPASVIGLILSDVPGDNFENVASGPTYLDQTTVEDAMRIIREKNLGDYELIETTKDQKYFEKVRNFVLVDNITAVSAMQKKAESLGFKAKVLSTELYDEATEAVNKIFASGEPDTFVLAAGEPKTKITKNGGSGGRNLYLCHSAIHLNLVDSNTTFASLASDGLDNSDMAGAIIDSKTVESIVELGLNTKQYYENYDSYNFFIKTEDVIETGPTGANVSDVMVLFKKK